MLSWLANERCWSYLERCELDRVGAKCERYPQLELEGGHTDEGDPWCVVCNQEDEGVILHIARIDGRYVIIWPGEPRVQRTSSIAAAVAIALTGLDHVARLPRGAYDLLKLNCANV